MKEQERIEVLKDTQIFRGRNNGKTLYVDAVFKAIQALKNEQRRKELIHYYETERFIPCDDLVKTLKDCEVLGEDTIQEDDN